MVNIPNSMTVLTDLLPVSLIMAERRLEVNILDKQMIDSERSFIPCGNLVALDFCLESRY